MLLFMAIETDTIYRKNRIDLDETLLTRIANGDGDALREVYTQTDRAVFGFALSIVKNIHDAEDVMQDTYIKINQCAEQYQCMGKPMAWILTIVKNLALNKLRQSGKQGESIEEQFHLESEENLAQNVENEMIISVLLHVLTDEEREIVVLHAQTGMKHREIAEILNLSLPTVLSKYSRALAKMRKRYNQ